jgi:hypothetical protein
MGRGGGGWLLFMRSYACISRETVLGVSVEVHCGVCLILC